MHDQHVYLLSTDASFSKALTAAGVDNTVFPDGDAIRSALSTDSRGLVVVDLQMPSAAGFSFLRQNSAQASLPSVVLTTEGDVSGAVEGMRHGAVDVIEKPFNTTNAVARVRAALKDESLRWKSRRKTLSVSQRLQTLTPRETQVLGQLSLGLSNRETGEILGISPRTVEVHRGRIMGKMAAKSMTSLVRMVVEAGLCDILPELEITP